MNDRGKQTLGAKVTPQQKETFTRARGDISQSEAVRLALRGWVEGQGFEWPEFTENPRGGDRKSQDFRDAQMRWVMGKDTR